MSPLADSPSFCYNSSHGLVENDVKETSRLGGNNPLPTSMIIAERVNPNGVSNTIRADLCFVRLRGRSSFQYGWHIVSYRLREGFCGGWKSGRVDFHRADLVGLSFIFFVRLKAWIFMSCKTLRCCYVFDKIPVGWSNRILFRIFKVGS